MKRFIAILLALAMCIAVPAFADGATTSSSASGTAAVTTETVYAKAKVPTGSKTVNLYQLPGEYRTVLSQLTNGTQLTVLFEGSTWHKVQVVGVGTIGWMKSTEMTITTRGQSALTLNSTVASARTTKSSDGVTAFRWGAGLEYDVMDNLSNGTYCWVFESANGWSRILLEDGRVGYVATNLLQIASRIQEWPAGLKGYVQVTGDSANFRDAASYSSNVIDQLYSGDVVDILGDYNGFLQVTKGKKTGYISHDIISPEGLNRTSQTAPVFYDNPVVYAGLTDVMQYVAAGTLVKVLATNGTVSRIEYDNIDGYVYDTALVY